MRVARQIVKGDGAHKLNGFAVSDCIYGGCRF